MSAIAPAQQPQPRLTPAGEAANGAVCTTLSIGGLHAPFTVKYFMQMRNMASDAAKVSAIEHIKQSLINQHFAKHQMQVPANAPFRARYLPGLWAGVGANAASGAAAEALAFGVREIGIRTLAPAHDGLSALQDFGLSAACGVIGAPINTAAEKVMMSQMSDNGKFFPHMKQVWANQGVRGFTYGTGACAARDAGFVASVFALNNACQRAVAPLNIDPRAKELLAAAAAGVIGGAATYPFDVVKTRMQAATSGPYPSALKVAHTMVQQEGLSALVNVPGVIARASTIGPLIAATALLKAPGRVPALLPQSCYEQAKANKAAHS